MKRFVLVLFSILLLAGIHGFAQKKATINFAIKEFDFGKIKEEGGTKTCRFDFTNTGNDTLKILQVNPGMSGAAVNWTKQPVAPKGKGYVEVFWDPKNKPGPFQKNIEVTTNDPDQPRIVLSIKGTVEPRQKTPADEYPTQLGNLRFKTPSIGFNNVYTTEVKTDTVRMYNDWDKPMNLSVGTLPDYLTVKIIPEVLKPKQKGVIIVSYDGGKRNDYGYVNDRFILKTNDSIQPEKMISISANITEDFSKLTPEELQKAPKIKFDNTTYDFGTVKEGTKVEHDFKFTNEGENDLFIRKVKGG